MRPIGSPEELERRRRRALKLLERGLSATEVATQVGVDRVSVYRWKAARREAGLRAIRAKPAPGRPPKLSEEQKRELSSTLLEGAAAAGFANDLWTCPRIAQLIQEKFGVQFHVDHVGRLLHGMGWSPQKPERRAIERDEDAIRTWVRKDWNRIKKKPKS